MPGWHLREPAQDQVLHTCVPNAALEPMPIYAHKAGFHLCVKSYSDSPIESSKVEPNDISASIKRVLMYSVFFMMNATLDIYINL